MRTGRRRRVDAALLGVGALAAGGVTVLGGLFSDTERIARYWAGATVQDTGASVTEQIDYDFGLATGKHGIIRIIPGLTTDDPITVSSPTAPDGVAERSADGSLGEPAVRVRIGDPAVTISGRHRYRIEYTHRGLLFPTGRISWDAVGTGWDIPIEDVEVHLVARWALESPTCAAGRFFATGGCEVREVEPGHLVVWIGHLDAHQGVTVAADQGPALATAPRLPAPPRGVPSEPGAGLLRPGALGAIGALGASSVASRVVRRRGRERVGAGGHADAAFAGPGTREVLLDQRDLAEMTTIEFAPPAGIAPSAGGVVLEETVDDRHKVAWLLESAIDGAVDLVEEGKRSVRLVRLADGGPSHKGPLDAMFAGRPELQLGTYDAPFARGWQEVDAQLTEWRSSSGLWDPAGDRRRVVVRALGGLAAIVGLVGLAGAGFAAARWGAPWLVLALVAGAVTGAGFAAALRGWELSVRTAEGSAMWLRVESFRRFLAESEAHHAEEAAQRGVLREYTAWAVAVGEIDRWERAVSASSVIPTSAGIGYVHLAPILVSSTSTTATAPSSSGSGGGGGSVGGGGGGGGGGSW